LCLNISEGRRNDARFKPADNFGEPVRIKEVPQKGSHKQFRHPDGRGTTVPFHQGRDISPILLQQIIKDIGLTVEEFLQNR